MKRHSFKPHALHFLLNYKCDVIFVVPRAYFVDNPHKLEIDSFKIAVSEHIFLLLYFKNSQFLFLFTHDNVRHTLCQTVMTLGVLSFSTGKHSTSFHRISYVYSFTF